MIDLDDLEKIYRALPFIGLMAQDQRTRPYITRLIEQSVPGILVASITLYTAAQVQEEKIRVLSDRINKIEIDRRDTRLEIKTELRAINEKVDRLVERRGTGR